MKFLTSEEREVESQCREQGRGIGWKIVKCGDGDCMYGGLSSSG